MDLKLLSKSIKDKALEIGFSKTGITEAKFYKKDQDNLEQWLSNGFHGSMNWIERRKQDRSDIHKYYSNAKAKSYLKRGYSLNKIRYSLVKKGINEKYIKASISKIVENESDPDFFSAIKLCKRRRIGPSREECNRPLFYKKDISILARFGFSYDTSKKVLDIPKEEFKKFCKLI